MTNFAPRHLIAVNSRVNKLVDALTSLGWTREEINWGCIAACSAVCSALGREDEAMAGIGHDLLGLSLGYEVQCENDAMETNSKRMIDQISRLEGGE